MSPRPKQYESNAEKQRKYRERQKEKAKKEESLWSKFKAMFNGNHKNGNGKNSNDINGDAHTQDTPQTASPKPNGTILIYDKFTGKRLDSESNQNSVQEALNPKIIRSSCLFCNAQMGYEEAREDDRCEFCRKFETKEQALYERMIASRMAHIKTSYNEDLIPKYEAELRRDWQCDRCKQINRYYVMKCGKCGGDKA